MLETFNRLQDEALPSAGRRRAARRGAGAGAGGHILADGDGFTGGDMENLTKLMEMGSFDGADAAWRQRQAAASAYIEPALDAYFTRIGTGPTGEDMQ